MDDSKHVANDPSDSSQSDKCDKCGSSSIVDCQHDPDLILSSDKLMTDVNRVIRTNVIVSPSDNTRVLEQC